MKLYSKLLALFNNEEEAEVEAPLVSETELKALRIELDNTLLSLEELSKEALN